MGANAGPCETPAYRISSPDFWPAFGVIAQSPTSWRLPAVPWINAGGNRRTKKQDIGSFKAMRLVRAHNQWALHTLRNGWLVVCASACIFN